MQATQISFTNHLMFNAVLTENEDLCIRLIEAVIGKQVENVEYLDDEVSLQPEMDARGARLDVLALVDGEYVDIEMQVGAEPDIERRCRFYHSAIATRYTPKGRGYGDIPRSYVIFICLSDPLGAGLARYELATACVNAPDVHVNDRAATILLNAEAWEQEENPEVAGMLRYALTGSSENGLARDIARAVDCKNLDAKWVRATMGVMTYEHEFIVLNNAIAKKEAQLAEMSERLDALEAQAKTAADQVEAAAAQVETATAQAEAATAQAEAATARAETATAEAEAATAQAEALQTLSKKLYAAGRIDEYIAALDNGELMSALLTEFSIRA